MDYVQLGDSGVVVSEICMGTMTFGSEFYNIGEVDQALANTMVDRALEAGVNFFDTANIYSYGESEAILGNALQQSSADRDEVVVATKVRGPMSEEAEAGTGDVNNEGLSRKHIMESCEASLNRLDMDYVDLYQVHGWDSSTPLEETLRALHDLVESGKVLYVGVSNWPARKIVRALEICRSRDWHSFVSLQAYYSLGNRDLEHELLPLSREEGLGVLPWSPLSGGFLTGKYRRDEPAPDGARRKEFDFPPIYKDRAYDAIEAMDEIASDHGVTIPQIALAWVREQAGVSSVIIGAKNMEQLEDNLASAEVELSDKEHQRLEELTEPRSIYPEWMVRLQDEGIMPGEDGS
jgi:aryl-alcohol dehydrogenase-like predicted oxidoreductase